MGTSYQQPVLLTSEYRRRFITTENCSLDVGHEDKSFPRRGPMDRKDLFLTTHFHIRWSGVARLDWERFATREQAEARAKELVRPGEIFKIEEFRKECERCQAKAKSA